MVIGELCEEAIGACVCVCVALNTSERRARTIEMNDGKLNKYLHQFIMRPLCCSAAVPCRRTICNLPSCARSHCFSVHSVWEHIVNAPRQQAQSNREWVYGTGREYEEWQNAAKDDRKGFKESKRSMNMNEAQTKISFHFAVICIQGFIKQWAHDNEFHQANFVGRIILRDWINTGEKWKMPLQNAPKSQELRSLLRKQKLLRIFFN